ncbi:bifunctional phosphopantothenoylcysteine decarboxylase/phosphopantothenate--cysteine ligase CoaBC [Intestinibacillus sp. Marseille-P6563]|uniref:bifunctional phosphopantothenoylcysteine decarboxylase/phosphopantothenate--cysteine ligase CoaBC n=1 Tax=Intestinibacillus sp. Marseille-P6563 TaxID=2364792 RepID=UPI000F0453D6|nr:bifunctional phosphopantothenoylcysteine decarboxylase/phosphopantothenate--cysteine ligase CoaBC [Intestinibacillus sp. Marseille-P6563]
MNSLQGKSVVLCVTGGIAAYKAADLTSKLKKKGAEVFILMTESATEFITPLTLEVLSNNRVTVDMFNREFPWEVEHISLAKRADVFVVAPATANVIGKAAHGIADDMVTTTLMATKAPLVIAPAMNTGMYENPVVQQNIELLRARGTRFVEPASGRLACGDTGKGKLADPAEIVHAIECAATPQDLAGVSVLVTAGPTREAMDPVRFLSNHSTGKMGYAIAQSAQMRGASVTLVSGPVGLDAPAGVQVVPVVSAQDMRDAVMERLDKTDWVIKAAAVGDYRPKQAAEDKLKKKNDEMSVELVRNPDILAEIGHMKRDNQLVCGFSMETRDLLDNSRAKLEKKNCDMMVANNLRTKGAGFAHDTNVATLLYRDGTNESLSLMRKDDLADIVLDRLLQIAQSKG